MRSKFKWIFTLLLAFTMQFSFAQEKTVTGTVTDGKLPLSGANVKNGSRGVQTDADGKFAIKANVGDVLTVTSVGFEKQTVKVGSSNNYNVKMNSSENILDDVVVVAYGKQKKEAITGSVGVVKSAEITKTTTSNAMQGLVGKIAGVQVVNNNGMPGDAPILRIRGISSINGQSSPLYVVDGAPFNGDLASINNADIESISVLKDASAAALYGSRGANGVVIVTTKKGKKGKLNVTFDSRVGFTSRAVKEMNLISDEKNYYEAYFQLMKNDLMFNGGLSNIDAATNAASTLISGSPYSLAYNAFNIANNQLINPNTGKVNGNPSLKWNEDYADFLFGSGVYQNSYLSVSGGNENTIHMFSVGYEKNEGYVVNSGFEKISTRMSIDSKISDYFKIGGTSSYSHTVQNYLDGYTGGTTYSNPFAWTRATAPIYPVHLYDNNGVQAFDSNGNPIYDDGTGNNGDPNYNVRPYASLQNPYATALYDIKEFKADNLFTNGYFKVNFTKDFDFNYSVTGELYNTNDRSMDTPLYGDAVNRGGDVSYSNSRIFALTQQQLLSYRKSYKNHNFDILLGHENMQRRNDFVSASRSKLLLPDSPYVNQAAVITGNGAGTTFYETEAYLARLNYDYKGKYFLNSNFRRDASSRFHPDNKWGNFYGVGLAWVLSKEAFMSNVKWIDSFKLKSSYGEQGNDNIANTALGFTALRPYDDEYVVNSTFDASLPFSFTITPFQGNKEITWEKKKNTNIGFEFEGFKRRIKIDAEYFIQKSKDLLYLRPLSPSSGRQYKPENIGDMQNVGYEISVDANIIKNKDWKIDLSANTTTYKNKITRLIDNGKPNNFQVSGIRILEEGGSVYDFYMREFVGVNPASGASQYLKDDGTITENYSEATLNKIGKTSIPDFFGGFGLNTVYKNFDISVNFAYQFGGYGYDSNYMDRMSGGLGENIHSDFYNTWTPENTNASLPRMDVEDSKLNYGTSTLGLIKSDYLSIQNIALGYNFNKSYVQKIGLNNLRFYALIDNVHLWSKRQGYDPRLSLTGGSDNKYSLLRTISLGVNVQF